MRFQVRVRVVGISGVLGPSFTKLTSELLSLEHVHV